MDIQDYRGRLITIVETAYSVVCQKIAAGSIIISNEASLQLHLGTVLKTLGQLYEFSSEDHFVIELEKSLEKVFTSKSNDTARCDIAISFKRNKIDMAQAFIELKFFKASSDPKSAEATKDNRFGLFMDLENLETYREVSGTQQELPLCYEIALAQNDTYANPAAKSTLKTGNGCWTDQSRMRDGQDERMLVRYAKKKPIDLKGNYKFEWTSFSSSIHSLIIRMQ